MEEGQLLDDTVDRHFRRGSFSGGQRGLLYEIVSGVVRRKSYLQWVLSRYSKRHVGPELQYLLWIALYQILFMKKASYHVVTETVEYAKHKFGQKVAGFVNAVLRRAGDAKGTFPLPQNPLKRLSLLYAFPDWLTARWIKRLGEGETERLLELLDTPPLFGIRVSAGKAAVADTVARLEEKGLHVTPSALLPGALLVDRLGPIIDDGLLRERSITIQDEASQLVGLSLQARPGYRILDACAGVGTKTGHIEEIYDDVTVVSMDSEAKRLCRITGPATAVLGDALRCPFREEVFDLVLVDAPCSSLGIIRKHPEIKWNRTEADVTRFGRLQRALLNGLWASLKTGGHLVYSVCSFEPEETLDVLAGLAGERKFILENPLPFLFNKEYFLSLPQETGMDGFFIARLRKL